MTINRLFDNTTNLLAKVLSLRARNAEVISGNLANIDTPGYKARQVTFNRTVPWLALIKILLIWTMKWPPWRKTTCSIMPPCRCCTKN